MCGASGKKREQKARLLHLDLLRVPLLVEQLGAQPPHLLGELGAAVCGAGLLLPPECARSTEKKGEGGREGRGERVRVGERKKDTREGGELAQLALVVVQAHAMALLVKLDVLVLRLWGSGKER